MGERPQSVKRTTRAIKNAPQQTFANRQVASLCRDMPFFGRVKRAVVKLCHDGFGRHNAGTGWQAGDVALGHQVKRIAIEADHLGIGPMVVSW